ncbi:MAG: NAD(P)-binding domain-containing protein [Candidatus Promineifilaceae bacterium]
MKIAVLGAGNIGRTLGLKWAAKGHEVIFGVRDVNAPKVKAILSQAGEHASAASVESAVSTGEVVVFAIPGRVMDETVGLISAQLAGKIVIDATNNVGAAVLNNLSAFITHSADVQYFRAFHSLGWENFDNPMVGGMPVDLFYCGDSGEAQTAVDGLIADIGLRPIYLGGREQLTAADGLTRLWFALVMGQGHSRRLVFKMLEDK